MTEFKKVELLLETVRKGLMHLHDALVCDASTLDAHAWDAMYHELLDGATDLVRRIEKLAGKALEQDPIKQIYNERMCARILELREGVRGCLREGLLLDDEAILHLAENAEVADEVHSAVSNSGPLQACYQRYEVSTLHQAQSKAWQDATAQSLVELLDRERVSRVVLTSEMKGEAATLFAAVDASRRTVRAVEDARAAALWQAETSRRAEEQTTHVPASLGEMVTCCGVDLHSPHWRRLMGRLAALLREVLANPERQGIRILRYTSTTISHFGHPCVGVASRSMGRDGGVCDQVACNCECRRMNAAAEAVLRMVGYEARYNSKPQHNAVVQSWFSGGGSDVARSELPCGGAASEHRYYRQAGFEPYGERSLVLKEPNPLEEIDAWCAWHAQLTQFVSELDGLTHT